MEYVKEDFKGLYFNVWDVKKGEDIYKKFPSLKVNKMPKIPNIDDALLFKFSAFMYDIKSPLQAEVDLRKRRLMAANLSGFPKAGNQFRGTYRDVAMYHPKIIVKLGAALIWYCKTIRGSDYAQLALYEQVKEEHNTVLQLGGLEAKEALDELKVLKELNTNITDLKSRFLAGDDNSDIIGELDAFLEFDGMEYSPEQIAFSQEVRDSITSGNPYAKWKYQAYSKEDLNEEELEQLELELANQDKVAQSHFKALGYEGL